MRRAVLLLLLLPVAGLVFAGGAAWVKVPGGTFRSALKYEDGRTAKVASFALQKRPVTNGEFLAFVRRPIPVATGDDPETASAGLVGRRAGHDQIPRLCPHTRLVCVLRGIEVTADVQISQAVLHVHWSSRQS